MLDGLTHHPTVISRLGHRSRRKALVDAHACGAGPTLLTTKTTSAIRATMTSTSDAVAIGERLGLSAADQRALGIVARRGPLTAGTLAQLTGLSPGAVTGLVDRLERAGHVTRAADPGDRRRTLISAVPNPRAGTGEAMARLSAEMTAMASRYDEKEAAAIVDYLRRTIEILREQTRLLGSPSPE
jgi:DNA-binding MarR family transcriptional regulator